MLEEHPLRNQMMMEESKTTENKTTSLPKLVEEDRPKTRHLFILDIIFSPPDILPNRVLGKIIPLHMAIRDPNNYKFICNVKEAGTDPDVFPVDLGKARNN